MSIGDVITPKMRYRLALDMGAASIGWCLIRLNKFDEPIAIIRMGVRIFSDGRNPKDGSSLAVTRRQARQMRRRRDRLLRRKERLMNALVRLGFFPEDPEERRKCVILNPYQLRKEGLERPLAGPEFARALFHINQRRGFLSNRKTDQKDSESGTLKKAISELRQKLEEENCRTLGEWLYKRHQRGDSVRARLRGKTKKDKAYDFYADRKMIEDEFEALWKVQAGFNPDLFTDKAREELKDILLFQRPLRPVRPGRCTLIPEEERAPSALPVVQRFRIYQELNHLRILDEKLDEHALSLDQRDTLANLLEKGDLTFVQMAKALRLPGSTKFNMQDIKRDRLKGNATSVVLARKQHFGERWHDLSLDDQNQIVEKILNEQSEENLFQWLQNETGVDESVAEAIASVRLPEGYGNLGVNAIRRILDELKKDVIPYSEAVKRAGFESHSALSLAEISGEIYSCLPYYGQVLQRHVGFGTGNPEDSPEKRFGRIANPTVHIGLNELRKLVNAIIERYGHPAEIVIELARELKNNRERRLEIQREQKEKQDRNERLVREACEVLGLDYDVLNRSKKREISQKMQLWIELNSNDVADRKCPYTGEQISIERLLSEEVEIDHILPFSKTLDDSLNNKTVVVRRANREKGNRTPYEAFGQVQVPGYDYSEILRRASLMKKDKAKRFAPDGYERWLGENSGFIARALNDTAYLSRVAKEYLGLVCPPNKVRAIPGRMTAQLRGMFGLNSLLSGSELKNRDDHRHHALDAAVIGITDQGMLQRFSEAAKRARELQLRRLVDEVPLPWPKYREHVARALSSVVVSHRPDHGYQGAMHEESAWGFREGGVVTKRVRPEGGGPRERKYEHKNLIPIRSTRNPLRHGIDENGEPLPYKGYVGGSNYCIEIWKDEKGRWKSDVVSTFQAYKIVRELGEKKGVERLRDPRLTLSGRPLVMRLMINDFVKMEVDGKLAIMRVVKITSNGQVFFAEHHESNVDARYREKSFNYISKLADPIRKAKGRRVGVSVLGDVRDPGFKG